MYHSIFNDVLGPIMTGPSSSHSAGCGRIGLTVHCLYGRDIRHAEIVFEEKGSYPNTYIGQGSNYGFVGGLLGIPIYDERLKDAVEIAENEGRVFEFKKEDLGCHHPNEAEIRIFDEFGQLEMSVMTYSTGGGMFEITKMDDFKVYIDGSKPKVFICTKNRRSVDFIHDYLSKNNLTFALIEAADSFLFDIDELKGFDKDKYNALKDNATISYIRFVDPVTPVVKKADSMIPFYNAREAYQYAKDKNKAIWELAIDYESSYGDITASEIWDLARNVLTAMRSSSIAPDPERTKQYGFLPYRCREMEANVENMTGLFDIGLLQKSVFTSLAVMENSCAHNIVVAAPTAGSSGIIPGAIVAYGDNIGLNDEEICKALLAAGLVGVFIANQATFGAEVAACQAEIGASAAMAAAGCAEMIGASVFECFNAASMAMQNLMGLICDPVGGLTEIPCISRNASAVANAVICANMSKLGFDAVIPLDETIITMKQVGELLPDALRCTCKGGLCATATGCSIQMKMDNVRSVLHEKGKI